MRSFLVEWYSKVLMQLRYFRGSLRAKILVSKFGKKNLVHPTVEFILPSNITIGNFVEIRSASTLDARSHIKKAICIDDYVRIKENVALVVCSGSIRIGKNVLVGRNTTMLAHGGILIDDFTMISQNCVLVASNHFFSLNGKNFQDQGFTKEPIHIGKNVWIGANCAVLAGSMIPNDTVVAAGSVVNSHLVSGYVYGGIPAVKLRKISENEMSHKEKFFKNWDSFNIK